MSVAYLKEKMRQAGNADAVAIGSHCISYQELTEKLDQWQSFLANSTLPAGAVVSVKGDYSADAIALFLALANYNAIIIPLSNDSATQFDEFTNIGQVEYEFAQHDNQYILTPTQVTADHQIYQEIRQRGTPGLVLFSSGSTGKSKAIVHDLAALLTKFTVPRNTMRTVLFLQFDHIGGINTLLYTLANGGMAIIPENRRPITVCKAIEMHKGEVLPTSPTFLNLLLLSGAAEESDISSLKLVTYGTEPMPASTLEAMSARFPNIRMLQTYGLSEVGILRSKSRDSNSLWVKVGGEDYQTKIVDGKLCIKSKSAMLGYLNAPSPFDSDGYMNTGDQVEQDGEWIRILGRESEIINVGGEKVYPAEVESAILQLDGVEDVVVVGIRHPITGMTVSADVKITTQESLSEFKVRLRKHCSGVLPGFKIPTKIRLIDDYTHNARFKRMRRKA
ncbi:fatty acid--CoA ligase family protein [Paraglaciecola sp.]|uniref:ANL family adenylate-forming protein n=1 Tax=Paraglaciecola sp. TaxID=1920173 RepID=UPI0027402429|nr:long-chain fatty acid--CoA ligase [Paraglaciecola sp.]MDP5032082.1 long-chain fatty acid--CoA ligase [Paraglaciecola sp.]